MSNKETNIPGLLCLTVFNEIKNSIEVLDEDKKSRLLDQVKGIFEFQIRSDSNKEEVEIITIDLKNDGSVYFGSSNKKEADTIIIMADNDFINVANGRVSSQKAYNLGKLKIKGQMKLATKLDRVLRQLQGKCKI